MKKRLLVLVMAGVMTASMLTACGSKGTTTTAAAETTTAAAETTAAADTDKTEAAADAGDFDSAAYLSWSKKEWSAASDEEKNNAAIAYSLYVTEAIAGQTLDTDQKALAIEEMKSSDEVKNVVAQLEATLSAADMTLKEFADLGIEQVNSAMESATAAQ